MSQYRQRFPNRDDHTTIALAQVSIARKLALVAAVLLVTMAAVERTRAASVNETVALDASSVGKKTVVRLGSSIRVRLTSQLGTGYRWTIRQDQKCFGPLTTGTPSEASQPGGGQIQEFVYQAVSLGNCVIRFDYRRPWRTDEAPAKSVSFEISIVASP